MAIEGDIVGSGIGGVSSAWSNFTNSIGHFIGVWGLFVFYMVLFFGAIGLIWFVFIKNNHAVIIKAYGHKRFTFTRGRKTYDDKTKTKGFRILRVRDYSGLEVSDNHIFYMRGAFRTRPCVLFAYDKDGNLHPVDMKESERLLTLDFISAPEKDVFLNQLEKANRKYPLSAEKWVKSAMIMVIICLLIVFGGTSYTSHKQSKSNELLAKAMTVNEQTNQRLADSLGKLYVAEQAPEVTQEDEGVNIITPFNNVITGSG